MRLRSSRRAERRPPSTTGGAVRKASTRASALISPRPPLARAARSSDQPPSECSLREPRAGCKPCAEIEDVPDGRPQLSGAETQRSTEIDAVPQRRAIGDPLQAYRQLR